MRRDEKSSRKRKKKKKKEEEKVGSRPSPSEKDEKKGEEGGREKGDRDRKASFRDLDSRIEIGIEIGSPRLNEITVATVHRGSRRRRPH